MYKFHPSGIGVIRLSDGAYIPSSDTAAWMEYMQWMYAGGTAEPADELVVIPRKISKLTIVSRLTDDEAIAIEDAKASWTAKERLTWEAAGEMVSTEDPLLLSFLISVLGEPRAMELLA